MHNIQRKHQAFAGKNPTFTLEELLSKIKNDPYCYLTGKKINFMEHSTYALDHKIPKSRGGTNNLDNLGLCCREINQAKYNLTPEEFIQLCKTVVESNTVK